MSRTYGALLLLYLYAAACGAQQATPPSSSGTSGGTGSTNASSDIEALLSQKWGPFTMTAGPETGGGFGLAVDGSQQPALAPRKALIGGDLTGNWGLSMFPAISYGLDAIASSDSGKPSNATLNLGPTLDFLLSYGHVTAAQNPQVNNPGGPVVYIPDMDQLRDQVLWVDLKPQLTYRYGQFEQNNALVDANQALVGGTVALLPMPTLMGRSKVFLVLPELSGSYYHPFSTSSSQISVPSNIKADYLQIEAHTLLGTTLGSGGSWPLELDIKFDESKATSGTDRAWQSLWQLQLSLGTSWSSVKPAITYKSGQQGGFQYDKQIILGLLTQFLEPKK